jgi:hypothetical protein
MQYTPSQEAALAAFSRYLANPDATAFLLTGAPGTGKSFLTTQILHRVAAATETVLPPTPAGALFEAFPGGTLPSLGLVCAPTHKALQITRRFLEESGIRYRLPEKNLPLGGRVVGTTSQLLGIAPVVREDQDETVSFGKAGKGILGRDEAGRIDYILVDEVSMLPRGQFLQLYKWCRKFNTRLIVVGDRDQLPPVKGGAIDFDKIKHQATLVEVKRQDRHGSMILTAGRAARDKDFPGMYAAGAGAPDVRVVSNVTAAFVNAVEPVADERDRAVFIAYRNLVVHAAAEAACQRLYGHGRSEFRAGQHVISENALMEGYAPVVWNQAELEIVEIDDTLDGWKRHALVKRPDGFEKHVVVLTPDERDDKQHPYNRELEHRATRARDLQAQYNTGDRKVDGDRREAWRSFFAWRDRTVLAFRHPFASTSHKIQGSTVRQAFVHARDLKRSPAGLYVGCTRPTDVLVLGR